MKRVIAFCSYVIGISFVMMISGVDWKPDLYLGVLSVSALMVLALIKE